MEHLGLKVTRLIRTQYGDYSLNTIPPGMAIEVPVKALDKQKKKGQVVSPSRNNNRKQYKRTSKATVARTIEQLFSGCAMLDNPKNMEVRCGAYK